MTRSNGSPHRLFIFGWDCADWTVIEEGWRRGMLPHLRAVQERGESGILMSTIPPVTAPAWTTFLTGKDPGEHGIFGFRTVDPSDYRPVMVPGGQRRSSTLFRQLDATGYRTCLVTVPWTYPPEALTGSAIVPGWDAPDESLESCYPAHVRAGLAKVVERVPRRSPRRSSAPRFLERQRQNVALRERICTHLIATTKPNVFMVVFPEPDQATHLFWGTTRVPESLLQAYQAVDDAMGRLISQFVKAEDRVLVLSDHGARPIHTYVHVGKVLLDAGFLAATSNGDRGVRVARGMKRSIWYRLPPPARKALLQRMPRSARRRASLVVRGTQVDWRRTRAFPSDHGPGLGVVINGRPQFPAGPVSASEYETVRQDVAALLRALTEPESGEPMFSDVLPREDVYQGPEVASAPDLLLVPAPGYGTEGGLDFTKRTSRVAIGGHRREGVFVANWGLGLGSVADIRDLLPRALDSCGFELRNLAESQRDESPEGYSKREAEEMETRLRELGYIE